MKTRSSLLIIPLTTSSLVTGMGFAPAVIAEEEEEWLVPERIISEPITSEIELGIGYVSDDAYKFGRYNGLQTKGPFLVGNIDTENFSEDGRFWKIHGFNLGLESRYLRLDGGKQGSHRFFLVWDELPNYIDNTVLTPFIGVGGDRLELPPGFPDLDAGTGTNIDPYLGGFELKTKRERVDAGASFIPRQRWQFDIDFSHENKKGVEATGGAINQSGASPRTSYVSILPEPVDYDTDKVNARMQYAADAGQLELSYHASMFNNNFDSLTWADPFDPATGAGRMSLPPDNEFHQLSLTGGLNLSYHSRITGVLSRGRMTQNQKFLPYTINTAATTSPLPRDSLDGEVWLTTGQLKFSSRPVTKLRLNAEYRYNERDNQTPVATYDYVVMDSPNGIKQATNAPYSYEKNLVDLNANYRFNAITSLRGGYKFDKVKRTNSQRQDTEQDTLYAKWKIKPVSNLDLELYGETSSRDGGDYITPPEVNPGLRKYYLADRDRTTVGAAIDFMATEKLFLSARGDYHQDDYPNTAIGLTESTRPVVTLDFSYQARNNISTYGYYTYESIQSDQNGLQVNAAGGGGGGGGGAGAGAATPTTGWQADFEDIFNTIGFGAKLTDLGKFDVGVDIVYSESTGKIQMKDLVSPGTENQYPDNKTELTSVKLWTDYHYNKKLVYRLGYWYERYNEDNWAIDGWAPYDPNAVLQTLLLGNTTLDYDVHVITASVNYRY